MRFIIIKQRKTKPVKTAFFLTRFMIGIWGSAPDPDGGAYSAPLAGAGGVPKDVSNINSAYFIHIMPKIGGAKAPSAPPGFLRLCLVVCNDGLYLSALLGCSLVPRQNPVAGYWQA